MSESLKLSIVTPSYNYGRFLEQAIISVTNQDYPNIEYIVIDGASRDNSVEIIRKHEKHIAYWISEPDQDLRYALQKGFARASGDVVAWQNADDYYEPDTFGRVMRVFQENPDVDLVYGNINIVNEDNRLVDELRHVPLYYPLDLFVGLPFQNHAAFFRRDLWERAGGITFYELNYDVDLLLRLAREAVRPFFLHYTIGNYRNHAGSLTFSKQAEHLMADIWTVRRRFQGRLRNLPKWSLFPFMFAAKVRRYAYLVYQGDWDYIIQHSRAVLNGTTATR